MKTPCRAACKNEGGICSGCKRTMKEIADWKEMTENLREEKMSELDGSSFTHLCPQCGNATHCDISAGKDTCWCFSVECREVSGESSVCLCRNCLMEKPLA
ncbi:cysteine-rich CWC family protein [Parasalinivibrio latis]|uniref:DUF1289 domain-containing protein n=1 Tax=Parasalinivibrio latis TaxID=2952610 RepID=UPI0030E40C45